MTAPRGIPRVLRILRSVATLALDYFRATITNLRFLTLSIAVGLISALAAWRLVASGFAGSPGSSPVWTLGADGSLVALAYGFVPLLLPFVPSGAAYYAAKRERESAFLETAMTRPMPRWGIAFGRFAGLAFAVAALHLVAAAVSVLVIYAGAAGTPLSGGLVALFVAATLLVGTLYLALAVWLTVLLTPARFAWLSVPLWFLVNAIEPMALLVTAQALLILPEQVLTFETTWRDSLSFTGLYQGLLAPFIPEQLAFVPRPDTFYSVPIATAVWFGLLLFLCIRFLTRHPLGKL